MGDSRRNIGVPSGVVLPFAGESAPYGYLICDGRAISRTDYADLFNVLSTSYGAGDGSTTFNLPDYRGQFLRGNVGLSNKTGSGSPNLTNNTATFNNHKINRTGFKIRLYSGTLGGLNTGVDYYAIVVDSNTLSFAASYADAIASTPVKIALSGTTNTAVIMQYEDPDRSVGSYSAGHRQDSDLQSHNHGVPHGNAGGGGSAWPSAGSWSDIQSRYTGGNETRPKNVSVGFIIKI